MGLNPYPYKMKKVLPHILFSGAFLLSVPALMQAQTTKNFSGWLAVYGTVNLNDKYTLRIEGNLRSTNEWEQIQTLLFRTGMNYKISANHVVTLGYAYASNARTINGVRGYAPEDRIWEQYSNFQFFSLSDHYISLQNRFRLEQRFIGQSEEENNQLVTDGFDFVQRFRYFIRAVVPFKSSPKREFSRGAYFALQNELFINIGDVSVVNGKSFDQNRAYFSLGYRFSPKNDSELAYLYQYVLGSGTTKTINNIIQLAIYIRL